MSTQRVINHINLFTSNAHMTCTSYSPCYILEYKNSSIVSGHKQYSLIQYCLPYLISNNISNPLIEILIRCQKLRKKDQCTPHLSILQTQYSNNQQRFITLKPLKFQQTIIDMCYVVLDAKAWTKKILINQGDLNFLYQNRSHSSQQTFQNLNCIFRSHSTLRNTLRYLFPKSTNSYYANLGVGADRLNANPFLPFLGKTETKKQTPIQKP
eukprot:TRINITY_DN7497_c0_g1_i1.p2 TRINITY_DN7497_c0_g1~~TRINITY_DN7497_c0_g1_i1.p2  ORF type:complete len:211 (-),score=-19.61 TRINITY_DN7497_c0_g1_i1:227-859(-)